MAKPLGLKSRVIREALAAYPGMGNTELAETINHMPARQEDGIEVKMQDVAQQKQMMKKAAANGASVEIPTRPLPAPAPRPSAPAPAVKPPEDMMEDLATIKRLVKKLGAAKVGKIAELFE